MKNQSMAVILFLALSVPGLTKAAEDEPKLEKVVGVANIERAIELATTKVNAFLALRNKLGPRVNYRMISVQNLLNKGPDIWWVTFKPEDMIPKDPKTEAIGVGGEIFITVNLQTNKTTLTHGE